MSFKNCKVIGPVKNPVDYFKQPVKRGDGKFQMSISSLKPFAECPEKWLDDVKSEDTASKDWGSLVDTLCLTPDQFKSRYAIKPETYIDEKGVEKDWHHASKTCKAWIEDHKHLTQVSQWDFDQAVKAVKRLRRDPKIADLIDASEKQVWVSGEWHDESGIVFPVKCLLDLVPRYDTAFYKNLGDLKTARNAALQPFTRAAFDLKYHWQAAFNMDLYKAAKPDEDRCNFVFIVQENSDPYQTGKRIMDTAFMELGRAEYTRALRNYAWCLKNEKWPDFDDTDESVGGWSILSPLPWMESASLFAPRYAADKNEQPSEENPDNIP